MVFKLGFKRMGIKGLRLKEEEKRGRLEAEEGPNIGYPEGRR
jgi:hypothetical protein